VPLDEGRYHGVRARYGEVATVEIVQVHALGDVDGYIERHLAPRLERYRHRASGKVDDRWQSRASGPGRLYGWQNGNWLFVIEATDDRLFDEAVDGFAYIRRK